MNPIPAHLPPPAQWNTDQLESYLTQQGFFHEEISVPSTHSSQMEQLVQTAKEYYQNRKDHLGHDANDYLEMVSQTILHRPLSELDGAQKEVLKNFIDILGKTK